MDLVKIRIEGFLPLMLDAFDVDTALSNELDGKGGHKASAARDLGTPLEQAAKRLYKADDGETLIIMQSSIRASVWGGGRYFKVGKKQVTTQRESMLSACVYLREPFVLLEHRQPWKVDTRPVVNQSTRGRFLCHRPVFDDWAIEFSLLLDTDILNVTLLRSIVDSAGKREGIGAHRQVFGKYKVTGWQVERDQE